PADHLDLHTFPTRRSSDLGTISQILSTSLQPNTTYTLLVDIGKRLESGLTADYSLTLQAGSTALATRRTSNGAIPAGSFQTAALDRKSTRLNSSHRTISYA